MCRELRSASSSICWQHLPRCSADVNPQFCSLRCVQTAGKASGSFSIPVDLVAYNTLPGTIGATDAAFRARAGPGNAPGFPLWGCCLFLGQTADPKPAAEEQWGTQNAPM